MSTQTKIKIDHSTLPADGQKVEWQTYQEDGTENWKQGTFVEGDDLFCVGFSDTHKDFNQAWDVYHWRPLEWTLTPVYGLFRLFGRNGLLHNVSVSTLLVLKIWQSVDNLIKSGQKRQKKLGETEPENYIYENKRDEAFKMKLDLTKKPQITISLSPLLEAYCRFVFNTPSDQKEIIINRKHDVGLLIHANVSEKEFPVKGPFLDHPVTFILPVNKTNHHGIQSSFLTVTDWGLQKIQDGIEYEFRKWVERRYEVGYFKRYEQKDIIDAILRGLNVRNNTANFDAIKKIDYRNRRRIEEKRFQILLSFDF